MSQTTVHLTAYESTLLSLCQGQWRTGRDIAKSWPKPKWWWPFAPSLGRFYVTARRLRERGLLEMRQDQDEDGKFFWFRSAVAGKASADS